MPRRRVLVATSAIHRKSPRRHRSRCLFPLLPSFLPSWSAPKILAPRADEPITPDPPLHHLLHPPSPSSPSSFLPSCRLHVRQPVHVGWPEARVACNSTLPELEKFLQKFRPVLFVIENNARGKRKSRKGWGRSHLSSWSSVASWHGREASRLRERGGLWGRRVVVPERLVDSSLRRRSVACSPPPPPIPPLP